jgi:hypothetical protein
MTKTVADLDRMSRSQLYELIQDLQRSAHEPRAPLRAPETAAEVILGGNWIVGYCASCTPVDGMHQPDCPILADMRAALNRGEKHV